MKNVIDINTNQINRGLKAINKKNNIVYWGNINDTIINIYIYIYICFMNILIQKLNKKILILFLKKYTFNITIKHNSIGYNEEQLDKEIEIIEEELDDEKIDDNKQNKDDNIINSIF